MSPITKRIDLPLPQRPMGLADHKPLLAFVRRVAPHLTPDFAPPNTTYSREEQPETGTAIGKTVVRVGDNRHGFEIVHTTVTHPHWGFRAVDDMVVSAYGLPASHSLLVNVAFICDAVTTTKSYVTLQVEGPEEAVTAIAEAFEAEFSPDEG